VDTLNWHFVWVLFYKNYERSGVISEVFTKLLKTIVFALNFSDYSKVIHIFNKWIINLLKNVKIEINIYKSPNFTLTKSTFYSFGKTIVRQFGNDKLSGLKFYILPISYPSPYKKWANLPLNMWDNM
jgi:hypothetical protein